MPAPTSPPIGVDQLAHDRQAEAARALAPLRLGRGDVEPLEDVGEVGGGDARAVVVDRQTPMPSVGDRRRRTSKRAYFERVLDQVGRHLGEPVVVGDHHQLARPLLHRPT